MSEKHIEKLKNVPKLRFPEFRDAGEWEEKKLGDIAELTSSKRVHLSDYVPNGIPFFRGKEISLFRHNQIPEDILYISEEHYKDIREKYGVPQIGDILITAVGTLGNVYYIRNSNEFYFKDGNLIWIKNISEDPMFLEISLNVKSKDVLSSAIGSSQKALTMVGLNKLKFAFPKRKEQQKIADCLASLDDRLAAETQTIDTLKAHKKGLMQQLFPAEGETLPKLRFPEFHDSGEWEIKPLGSKAIKVGSGITPNGGEKNYKSEGRPFIRSQNIGWGCLLLDDVVFIDDAIHSTFSATEINEGDVFLNITGASIGRSAVADYRVRCGNVNQHVCIIRTEKLELNPYYLNQYLLSIYGQKQIDSFQSGGNRQGLNFAQIRSFSLPLPLIEEQQKIADCLTSLDETIAAQAETIALLKVHKKGLMQQLFPAVEEAKR